MAETAGQVGDIRWRPTITATTISFVDSGPDTILDSNNGFVTAGIVADGTVVYTVSGSNTNDANYIVDTVAPGTLTLAAAATLGAEAAGNSVTIQAALPGIQLAGFRDWTMNYVGEALETTDFGSSGNREFIAGLTSFNATAAKHWLTTDNQNSWLATIKLVRFFSVYDSAPATTNAFYFQGEVVVTGLDPTTPVDALVSQNMTMQGTGALTPTIRSTAWPVAG